MPKPNIFAHGDSGLNAFLYADIGPPDGTGALTIASLFGRHGDDPWEEAARLSRLPVAAAVASLASMIAGTPSSRCSLPEAMAIAERLVALLPRPATGGRLVRAPRRLPVRWQIDWLAGLAAGLGFVVLIAFAWLLIASALGAHGPEDHDRMVDPTTRESPR